MSAEINRRSFIQLLGLATATVVMPIVIHKEAVAEEPAPSIEALEDGLHLYALDKDGTPTYLTKCYSFYYKEPSLPKFRTDDPFRPGSIPYATPIWDFRQDTRIKVNVSAVLGDKNKHLLEYADNWCNAQEDWFRRILVRYVVDGNVTQAIILEDTGIREWTCVVNYAGSAIDFDLTAQSITKMVV